MTVKPLSDFHRDRGTRDGHVAKCKQCKCAITRQWHQDNPDRARAAGKAWVERNREKTREAGRRHRRDHPDAVRASKRKSRYGITPEQFDAFFEMQGGVCAICGIKPRRWEVDHAHDTKIVRGLLCGPCNRGIGQFAEDVDRLGAAARYLARFA